MSENEVYKCGYEQNIDKEYPESTNNSFTTSINLVTNQAKNAETCNFIIEVSVAIPKALVTQNRTEN